MRKHGVSIAIIEELFTHEFYISGDIPHSNLEERFIVIGRTPSGRGVFVGFTFRSGKEGRLIRPITARFMHKREIEKYDKAFTAIKE